MDFEAAVQAFEDKLAEFQTVWAFLTSKASLAATNDALKAEYDDLMSRGSLLQSTIDNVTAAIDYVRNAASQVTSIFDGLGASGRQLGALGIAPLILLGIIGTITGGTAFIVKWLTDAYALTKKLQAQQNLLDAGADPNVLAQQNLDSGGFMANLGSTIGSGLLWLAVGLGAIWLVRKHGGR